MEFNENQKKAIQFYEGACNVMASAGSGKTSTLVHRIKNLVTEHGVDPNKILAITFSKKAKENMINRLAELMPEYYNYLHIETFHSFGYSIVRKFNKGSYQILDADWKKNKIIEDIYKKYFRVDEVNGLILAECVSYISMQKNKMIPPKKSSAEECDKVYYYYEKHKRENNLLDFDDMLTIAHDILSGDEKALAYCQKQYQFILADEMQDTNAVQYEIIRLIAQKHQNLYVVSDMKQCIFEWRGATNKFVMDFDSDWKNATTINLNCNYRSSDDIVSFSNRFAQTLPESKHKHYVESVSFKPMFKQPEYCCHIDEFSEANNIAQKIKDMVLSGDYKYNDFAILARTNAQLLNFESSMHQRQIPYLIVDGLPFVERKEIKIVLSYLRLAYDLSDNDALEYIYNKPNRYLGKQFLDETRRTALKEKTSMFYAINSVVMRNKRYAMGVRELIDTVNYLRRTNFTSVKNQIEFIRKKLKLDAYISGEVSDDNNAYDKIDNLDTLSNIAADYTSTEEFIDYMSKLSNDNSENDDTVKIMTIHKSKGLEFPVVFIVGVNDGQLPHYRNENENEERRLMYVAITRAEQELFISSTAMYHRKAAQPSIFINELFSNN